MYVVVAIVVCSEKVKDKWVNATLTQRILRAPNQEPWRHPPLHHHQLQRRQQPLVHLVFHVPCWPTSLVWRSLRKHSSRHISFLNPLAILALPSNKWVDLHSVHVHVFRRCRVCYETFTDPVMASRCAHNFCSICVRKYVVSYKPQCPQCLETLHEGELRPNRALKEVMDILVDNFMPRLVIVCKRGGGIPKLYTRSMTYMGQRFSTSWCPLFSQDF